MNGLSLRVLFTDYVTKLRTAVHTTHEARPGEKRVVRLINTSTHNKRLSHELSYLNSMGLPINVKVKSVHEPSGPSVLVLNSYFFSMKRLGILLLPPG